MAFFTRFEAALTWIGGQFKAIYPRLLPTGGTTGQVLSKTSATNYEVGWSTPELPVKGLSSSCAGKPGASEMVGSGVAAYALTLSAANSKAVALVAATASTVLLIKRNGTQIGTITFAAAGTSGTFAYSSTAITVDQNVTIHAPATPDATLADLSFLLRA